ncbi:heterogeneous nuclear ribonucleoprotein H2 [Cimex lectularius]|uniref:RRM domain-containing protein n=1 Tax=Cimex lectularius TaxID=79782 RepID=A0A8I6TIV8_CIMLE|nr:heterogeneous nuclear ribonucleoprotein H2 [Cimex lectularius]
MMGQTSPKDEGCVVKVRGLPWSTTEEDIVKFFSECNIRNGKKGVQMTLSREGRPSGEAYIEMETPEDVELACKKDRDYMAHRYIEVFKANKSEMDWVVERCGHNMELSRDDACVRLRGLPFDCTIDEIISFFRGLEIVGNGIILATDSSGRTTGEAYVQFVNKDTAEAALLKHKEKIGHRYIEIFRSSIAEAKLAAAPKMRSGFSMNQRHTPYDRNERFGGVNRYNSMSRNNQRNFRGMGGGGGFNDFDDGPWDQNNSGGVWDMPSHNRGGIKPLIPNLDRGNFGGSGNWQPPTHCIHMRGLPFRASQADIADFFRPIIPVSIRILFDNHGRPSGEADVEFGCHDDAVKAMAKDKSHMQHRYIELFMDSTPGGGGGGGDRGFGSDNGYNGGGNFRRGMSSGGGFQRRY